MTQEGPGEPVFVLEPTQAEGEQATVAEEGAPSVSALQQFLPGALLAFGVLVLVMVMVRLLRRNLSKNAPANSGTPKERIERIRAEASARPPAETFQADAEELTRRLAAILDNKAARLELLIEEADERLARLDRASIGASVSVRPVEPDAGAFRTSAPEPAPVAPAPQHAASDPTHRQIYELADAGLGPVEIAQRLDQPIGQVELILNLRRRGA
ncbi:MAG: hypothetical protein ACIARR_07900 [Phycisphaerales bacterium JB059]